MIVSGREAILQKFITLLVMAEILCKKPTEETKESKEIAVRVLMVTTYSLEKYIDLTESRTFLPSVLRMKGLIKTELRRGKSTREVNELLTGITLS